MLNKLAEQITDHQLNLLSLREEELSTYQKMFKKVLGTFGVSSPSELEGDKKKEFFDKIDSKWKAKNETD